MNISLTPQDNLNRMLHTFSATAYEIADCNYHNLDKLKLISIGDPIDKQLRWETIELDKLHSSQLNDNLLNFTATSLRFEGVLPGERFNITYNNGVPYSITIGATGSYIINFDKELQITEVRFLGGPENNNYITHQGTLTYSYYSRIQNRFDSITDVIIQDCPLEQFIGHHLNVIDEIQDVRTQIYNFNFLHASLREVRNTYINDDKYYLNQNYNEELKPDPYVVYKLYDSNLQECGYLDGSNKKRYNNEEFSTSFEVNGSIIDLFEQKEYFTNQIKSIKTLKVGLGVMLEVSYHKQIIKYSVETNSKLYPNLVKYREAMEIAYGDLYEHLHPTNLNENNYPNEVDYQKQTENLTAAYTIAYNSYILELEKVLKQVEEMQNDTL